MASDGPQYDVIIVDLPDPVGPALALFSDGFYAACAARLAAGGVLVTLKWCAVSGKRTNLRRAKLVSRKHFDDVSCFVMPVPTYVGGHMAIGWATNNPLLRETGRSEIEIRHAAAGGFMTRYWSPAVQEAAFVLPPFIAAATAS